MAIYNVQGQERTPIRFGYNRPDGFQKLNRGVSSAPDEVLGGRLAEEGEYGERIIGDLLETAMRDDDNDSPIEYNGAPVKKDGSGRLIDVMIEDD